MNKGNIGIPMAVTFGLVSLSLISCGNDGPTRPVPQTPARITLSVEEATLTAVGEALRLVATVLDLEGVAFQVATVTWTSSNPYEVNYDVNVDVGEPATPLINGWGLATAASGGVTATASIITRATARVGRSHVRLGHMARQYPITVSSGDD